MTYDFCEYIKFRNEICFSLTRLGVKNSTYYPAKANKV